MPSLQHKNLALSPEKETAIRGKRKLKSTVLEARSKLCTSNLAENKFTEQIYQRPFTSSIAKGAAHSAAAMYTAVVITPRDSEERASSSSFEGGGGIPPNMIKK